MCCVPQVAEELQGGPMSAEEKELLHLLTSPHLKVDKRGCRGQDVALEDALWTCLSPLRHLFCVPGGCPVSARHRGSEEL